ncbi:MAG: phosphotransferase [Firmicutes bacterium]|nr:phosphotransferase [Bacillota bacterium]
MSEKDTLKPGKHFPASMTPPGREDILAELAKYGFEAEGDIRLIDTSHDADDIRLNYIIDKKWVLRFCNAPDMTENRLREMNRLIDRYIRFGLRCPRFLTDQQDVFFHEWTHRSAQPKDRLVCYLAEYVDLPTAYELKPDPEKEEEIWLEVLDSVAGFAEEYRDVDLSGTFGMYSLFDLSPFDIPLGIDEKQQNFNSLCEELRKIGETTLVEKLEKKHTEIRKKIRSVYRDLPHCVFQADENLSNVLVDENLHIAGLIDFNLAGTEVIVNQFANLGGGFKEEVNEPIGAKARMDYAMASYEKYQGRMLKIYHANDLERKAIEWYSWIALVAGWPQVCFFLEGLKNEALKDEILELLGLLAEQE